jgi:hypothetical protein
MKIKGFDKNLCCRGMQYEIGKEYKTNAEHITANDLCSDKVLHYCDSLQNVHEYYDCNAEKENRYCEIEVLGEEITDGEKYGSNHIKIIREIVGDELMRMKGLERGNTGLFNSGDRNSGYLNSGDRNSGNRNSGYLNSGYRNSGDYNSGDLNSGDLNSGYRNSGVFCNKKKEDTVIFFNKESNMTWDDWYNHIAYKIALRLEITKWIDWEDMTDAEKEDKKDAYVCGGYLKVFGYKEAWANLWKTLDDKQKNSFKTLPNFDADIFEDITGIKIN